MTSTTHQIRRAKSADLPFISRTWHREIGKSLSNDVRRECSATVRREVAMYLIVSSAKCGGLWVACQPGDANHLLGFVAGESYPTKARHGVAYVHMAYLRPYMRGLGIGREMVELLVGRCRRVCATYDGGPKFSKAMRARGWAHSPTLPLYSTIAALKCETER